MRALIAAVLAAVVGPAHNTVMSRDRLKPREDQQPYCCCACSGFFQSRKEELRDDTQEEQFWDTN